MLRKKFWKCVKSVAYVFSSMNRVMGKLTVSGQAGFVEPPRCRNVSTSDILKSTARYQSLVTLCVGMLG